MKKMKKMVETRSVILVLLLTLASLSAACSYSMHFVVVNASDHPIEVRCKIKAWPGQPDPLGSVGPLSITTASQLRAWSTEWRDLSRQEYGYDQESKTVAVLVMPGEAVQVQRSSSAGMSISFPIEEINIAGVDGEVRFQGEQAFKAFLKQTDRLFTLTYR
jgi:hypothetical protein